MELIVSALFLLSAPLSIALYFLGMAYRPKEWKRYTFLLVLSLFSLAYAYKPFGSPDLVRYFEQLDECAKRSLGEVFVFFDDSLYLKNILFWVIAKLDLRQLLPGLTALCVYSSAAYITNDTAERLDADRYILYCIAFELCMLPFFTIINNVRNLSAFALALMAVYMDLVKGKRNPGVFALYIVPCLIHPSAILMLGLRLVVGIARKGKLIIVLVALFTPTFINLFYSYKNLIAKLGPVGRIINSAVRLAYSYMTGERASEWAIQVSKSGFQKVNRLVMMSFSILVILFIVILQKYIETEYKKFLDFLFLINVVVLACKIFVTPQYWRFSSAGCIAIAPLLMLGFTKRKELPFYFRAVFYVILLYPPMGLVLQLWYSQYMVDYTQYLPQMMVTNIYTILWDVIMAVIFH